MGNLFSSSTSNNSNKQTKLNNRSNNITKSYAKPKTARYLFSTVPLFSNLFGADQKYNIFFMYNVNNEDLDENNFAQTFIHKILSQDTKKLDEKIQELQKLKSSIEAVRHKEHVTKESPTYSAKMIIIRNREKYQNEIDEVIKKLKLQNTKNTRANNGSAAKSNDVGSKLPVGNEETSTRRSNLNNPAKSVGRNLPNGSEGNPAANAKMTNPAIITTTPKVNSKTNLSSITQNVNPANSVGNPSQINADEEKKKKNMVAILNSNIKYNNKNNIDIYKIYHEINKILDLLSKQIIHNIRNKYNDKMKSNNTKNIKLYEIEPNDVKDFIKLLLIFRILINPETLTKDYEKILILIDHSSKKIVTIINPNEDTISNIRKKNEAILITNSDNEIVKIYKEFIFDRNTDDKEIKKLIKSIKTELIKQNNVKLKQEFNIIISRLLSSYPLIIPGYKKPQKTTGFPKSDTKSHEQRTLNSLRRQFKIYENNKKNIIIPQEIQNEFNNNSQP